MPQKSLVIIVVIVMFDIGIQELTKNDPAAEAACREWGSWCCDLGCQHKSEFGLPKRLIGGAAHK